jgi:hypothetical protein
MRAKSNVLAVAQGSSEGVGAVQLPPHATDSACQPFAESEQKTRALQPLPQTS